MENINPTHRIFESSYVNLDIGTFTENIGNLLATLDSFWPVSLETLEYSYLVKDGRCDKSIEAINYQEAFNNIPSNIQALTLWFKHLSDEPNFGFQQMADEHIMSTIDFSRRLISISLCIAGNDNANKVYDTLTQGIMLIKTSLPERHQHIEFLLKYFYKDHPNPDKNIFIIMRFKDDHPFKEIHEAIEQTCINHGLNPVRADQKAYSDDLWDNVLTYMYGCNFAIAVFDEINYREFNPNVALEVGFMLSQTKRILLLKDQAINSLPTDIVGKMYHPFNTYEASITIPPQIEKWFVDLEI